jgi:hypothetical protein
MVVVAPICLLAACSDNTTTVVHNRMVPKQQEAADLQRAYNEGLLSPTEYEQQKRMLGL